MLRRRLLMIALSSYNWLCARLKIGIYHKAKLDTAQSDDLSSESTVSTLQKSSLETHTSADIESKTIAQTMHEATLGTTHTDDILSRLTSQSRLCAKLIAYVTSPIRMALKLATKHNAKLHVAPSQSMESGIVNKTELTANIDSAASTDLTVERKIKSVGKVSLDSANAKDSVVDVTAKAVHKASLGASSSSDLTICGLPRVSLYAKLSYAWVMEFYNYDGKLLYNTITRPNEDCPDPVAEGLIDAPTRPSDERYHYTAFAGWSTVNGGDSETNGGEPEDILSEQDLQFGYSDIFGCYSWESMPPMFALEAGKTYTVHWGDDEYTATAEYMEMPTPIGFISGVGLGNRMLAGIGEDTGEPFIFAYLPNVPQNACFTLSNDSSHKVAIYQVTEGTEGDNNSNPLKNVTEARVLYAAYEKEPCYYTATFYDSDGVLLHESQVAYGEQAVPPDTTRKGYIFAGWNPSDLTITKDTTFVGTWEKAPAVDILSETRVTEWSESDQFNGLYEHTFSATEGLVTGGDYTVVWDGEEYTCIARDITYTINNHNNQKVIQYNVLGNAKLVTKIFGISATTTEQNTNEPFNISIGTTIYMYCADNNEHTVRIYYE